MSKQTLFLLIFLGAILLTIPAHAQTGGPYELSWFTIDVGGATTGNGAASAGAYTVQNTTAQPEPAQANGGAYVLRGGFWVKSKYSLYMLVLVR